jgi:hypothetical protein
VIGTALRKAGLHGWRLESFGVQIRHKILGMAFVTAPSRALTRIGQWFRLKNPSKYTHVYGFQLHPLQVPFNMHIFDCYLHVKAS